MGRRLVEQVKRVLAYGMAGGNIAEEVSPGQMNSVGKLVSQGGRGGSRSSSSFYCFVLSSASDKDGAALTAAT